MRFRRLKHACQRILAARLKLLKGHAQYILSALFRIWNREELVVQHGQQWSMSGPFSQLIQQGLTCWRNRVADTAATQQFIGQTARFRVTSSHQLGQRDTQQHRMMTIWVKEWFAASRALAEHQPVQAHIKGFGNFLQEVQTGL